MDLLPPQVEDLRLYSFFSDFPGIAVFSCASVPVHVPFAPDHWSTEEGAVPALMASRGPVSASVLGGEFERVEQQEWVQVRALVQVAVREQEPAEVLESAQEQAASLALEPEVPRSVRELERREPVVLPGQVSEQVRVQEQEPVELQE